MKEKKRKKQRGIHLGEYLVESSAYLEAATDLTAHAPTGHQYIEKSIDTCVDAWVVWFILSNRRAALY